MKKGFLLLIWLITSQVFAQTWIAPNATWHYNFEELSGTGIAGFYKYTYSEDTILAGKTCQRIDCRIYEFYTYPQVEFLDSSDATPQFTYLSNDTVYYWNNNAFFVLFDFGAAIGDTWIISTTNNGSGFCNDTSWVEVTEIGTTTINSQNYRTITLETVDGSSFGLSGVFNEKFGFMTTFSPWHLFPRTNLCDDETIVEWYYVSFKCYQDDVFSLYNPSGGDCEYLLTHLDLTDQLQNNFTIYPNPVTENTLINTTQSGILTITNLAGQEVEYIQISGATTVDLSELAPGTYIVRFKSESGSVTNQLITKL